ncbi:hypothetical protein DH2020_048130 [Rehmannia glutinosa]|uniref:RING-type domain-containing protein n=1 Tax=Rehmannia glutinosa TaxID=99300 RepID=A0ABR0U6N8_REHGL
MDDSCAVCAESLDWVAYGACGHKDVCSTCVARLRFICDDNRCCICKTESDVVFVTKALGDYTKTISDFSLLPSEVREGRVGQYWYHEDTQAFFDDLDHYKMIKAMCRLSCSVCDKMEDQPDDGSRRRAKFRNIEQLRGHLFHKHRLLMCSLCLEGRKIHFRREHFLCEDEGCLAKKFIVFLSEAELKIPTSFRYRRSSEQDNRRRGRTFRRDPSGTDSELSLAIQASLETATAPPSSTRAINDHGEFSDAEFPPVESLAVTDSETPSRYLQAVSHSSRSGTLGESSFPPLRVAPGINQPNPHPDGPPKKTMAAHLRRQSNKKANASSSAPAWPAASRTPAQPVINPNAWPSVNAVSGSVSTSGQSKSVEEKGPASSSFPTPAQTRPPAVSTSSFAALISSRASGSTSRISHSSSAPNLSERESLGSSINDFPPVSAVQPRKAPATENVHTANKSLVEKMRIALGFDEDKFTAFKDISGEYRQGSMDAETYLAYAEQFGLSHLVPELARLLPNSQKQKELIDAYNLNMAYSASRETGLSNGVKNDGKASKKGKGKSVVDSGNSIVKNNLADNVISTVKELQSSYKASEEEVEVLSKDGYRAGRGKSKVMVNDSLVESSAPDESTKLKIQTESLPAANQNSGNGDGKVSKRRKLQSFTEFGLEMALLQHYWTLKILTLIQILVQIQRGIPQMGQIILLKVYPFVVCGKMVEVISYWE